MAPEVVAPQKEAPDAALRPRDRLPDAVPLLPLVIGVTGHRDLRPENIGRLGEEIGKVFAALNERCPNTPLVLLSSLAEGADRVAAEVAVRSKSGLMVVLPMPLRHYEEDFQPPNALPRPDGAESALDEFRRLLNAAAGVIELPLVMTEEEVRGGPARRALHYEQVGAFIALHSQVLLALWDGVSPPKVGGTSEVVHFQLNGVPKRYAPLRTPLDPLDSGPVYHLVTPRAAGHGGTIAPAFSLRKGFPSSERGAPEWTAVKSPREDPEREKPYQRVFDRIDSFNRDIKDLAASLSAAIGRSRSAVFHHGEDRTLPDTLQHLLTRYSVADAMALHFQTLTRRTARRLFLLTAFAALALVLFAHGEFEPVAGYRPQLLLAYVAAVLVGLGVALWTRWGDFQNRFQDYRALAEGLRVQMFWRLAGVPGSVADHYLLKQKGELDWIRQALRAWGLQTGVRGEAFEPRIAGAGREVPRIDLVLTRWVDDQLAYYTRAAHRSHGNHVFYGPLGKIALAVGIGLALVVAAQQATDWLLRHHFEPSGRTILAMTVPLVVAGLLEGYARVMAFSEHAKQFGRMSVVFGKAKEVLQGLTGPEHQQEAQGLLRDLGKEALAENGDWLLLHRERPLEFHSPH